MPRETDVMLYRKNGVNQELEKKLNPNKYELLTVLSESVNNSMLLEIAKSDYEIDVELHLKVLKNIRDKKIIPAPIDWYPKEVLELIRWSEPSEPNWEPGSTGKRGHIMRAFCCVVLLMAASEKENEDYFDGENDTLAQLIESLEFIGAPYEELGLSFLAWRLKTIHQFNEERPFFIFAILFLVIKLQYNLNASEIIEIINDLFEEEYSIRNSGSSKNTKWLLGLTFFDQKHNIWLSIGEKLLILSYSIPDKKVQSAIIGVSKQLMA